ncbi:sensor histidine kinase [Oscillibacter sp.]|uniref:sensor histidine kinase n=1 Tax=Oscillibacter sp. TaxID=1945593 RepID=UPI002D808C9E|nr:sensor histidine kinase [Oscillibacter sp.]
MKRLSAFFVGSLRNRLILYFTLLMMVPLSAAGYLIYMTSDVRISDSAMKLATQIVEKDSKNIDQVLSDMQAAVRAVSKDEAVQILLQEPRTAKGDRDACAYALGNRLKQISGLYRDINGIYVWLDDGTLGKSRYYSPREVPLLTPAQYTAIRNHARSAWFAMEQGSLMVDNLGEAVLSLAASLSRADTGQPCGIVIVEVRRSHLNSLMDADFGDNGTLFLMDPDSSIVFRGLGSNGEVVAEAAARIKETTVGMSMEVLAEKDRLLLCQRVPANGWVVAGVVFKDFLRNDSREILSVFILTALAAFLLNIAISNYLANFELQPLERMRAYILRMEEGDFGEPLTPMRPDEIGHLTASVQEMSEKIGELMDTVKTEQERLRNAEFRMLQAQINPHFLYNSLDSINWLARRGDVQKMTEMITALTTFFRIGLSKGRDIIALREEVEHIRSYLVIQKIRYSDQFEYSIYTDPATENCFVPKLILQPLVENALYHGIKLCPRKCMLVIQIFSREDHIELEVLDNGVGMDGETLEALREAMAHTGQNRTNSYGVINVNDRIQILAGSQYGLTFTSEKGVGTSVRIVLPNTLKGESADV